MKELKKIPYKYLETLFSQRTSTTTTTTTTMLLEINLIFLRVILTVQKPIINLAWVIRK
jgi:hypothetical protein